MFFIRLSLANTWKNKQTIKQNEGHGACFLTNCRERWTWFEIAVRMENLRGMDWDDIQNSTHRIRSIYSRSILFSVVFMCLIYPTQKFTLGKSRTNYQGMRYVKIWWDFGVMNLCYGLFFSAGVLCSSELGFDSFCFCTKMLDKENWRKDYRFLFFICSLVSFLYTAKGEFSSKFGVYIKDCVPRVVSVLRTVGLTCSSNIRLSTLGVWKTSVQ